MLDDRLLESFTIAEAAAELGAHRSHLVRVFTTTFGIAPHRYVIGRRVDRAHRLLRAGHSPAKAAVESEFHDQAHLTRHFRSTLGAPPAYSPDGRGRSRYRYGSALCARIRYETASQQVGLPSPRHEDSGDPAPDEEHAEEAERHRSGGTCSRQMRSVAAVVVSTGITRSSVC